MAYVARRWQFLADPQRTAWDLAGADSAVMGCMGRSTSLPGYNLYVETNVFRMSIGLSVYDLPQALLLFTPSPVAELLATIEGGVFKLKLHVLGEPVVHTLVQGARPVRSCVRCVQHFPLLGLLPPPIAGWSDITELYIARYGVPKAGTAVWIRTCQHIDGFTDVPRTVRIREPAATP